MRPAHGLGGGARPQEPARPADPQLEGDGREQARDRRRGQSGDQRALAALPDLPAGDGRQRHQGHRPLHQVGGQDQGDQAPRRRPGRVDAQRRQEEGPTSGRARAQPLGPGPVGEVGAPPGGQEDGVDPGPAAQEDAQERREQEHAPHTVLVGYPGASPGLTADPLLPACCGAARWGGPASATAGGSQRLAGGQEDVVLGPGAGLLRGGADQGRGLGPRGLGGVGPGAPGWPGSGRGGPGVVRARRDALDVVVGG